MSQAADIPGSSRGARDSTRLVHVAGCGQENGSRLPTRPVQTHRPTARCGATVRTDTGLHMIVEVLVKYQIRIVEEIRESWRTWKTEGFWMTVEDFGGIYTCMTLRTWKTEGFWITVVEFGGIYIYCMTLSII